jgi:hypothetical protein
MRETSDLYDNPEADANELQKVEQEEPWFILWSKS